MAICAAMLLSLLGVVSIVLAKPSSYDYGFDIGTLFRRQSGQPVQIVTGPPTFNGTVSLRRELRDVKKDPYAWNLLMLSLDRMKNTDQNDSLSYYQISGIHGVPLIPYNGVQAAPGGESQGYCAHANPLFPTWHRPYIAFIEQTLYGICQGIVTLFNDTNERAAYQNAANNFRLPYWDWSVMSEDGGSAYLPDFKTTTISVYGPRGLQTIDNPLFTYKFNPFDPSIFYGIGFTLWNQTLRDPTTTTADAVSQNDGSQDWVDRDYTQLRQQLYMMWTSYADYNIFSNKEWSYTTNASAYHSLEQIHDTIHADVGLTGHMNYTPFSAFDPVFWFHHVMIDRCFAWWQALWPNAWVAPAQNLAFPMWTVPLGTVVDSTTPLTPFYSDNKGNFWTSDSSRETHVFGYAYAETAEAARSRRHLRRRQQDLAEKINGLYGDSTPLGMMRRHNRRSPDGRPRGLPTVPFRDGDMPDLTRHSALNDRPIPSILLDGSYTEWLANCKVRQTTLGGPFTVLFFLGGVPADPASWPTAKNLVGTWSVSTGPGGHERTAQVSSAVPLTAALMKAMARGNIGGLGKAEVVPLLRRQLKVRAVTPDGAPVDVGRLEGLRVSVASATVRAPASSRELPHWGPVLTRFHLLGAQN